MTESSLKNQALRVVGQAIDVLLPPRCVLTGEMVERQGMLAPGAWAGLEFIGDPFCFVCGRPFEFEIEQGAHCTECLEDRPVFETARAALKYNDASRKLILGFKHADKMHAVLAFVPWLKRSGAEILAQADFLAPVPLHYWRFLSRRYNQSAIIACALQKETGVACLPDLLRRTRSTPSQGHLKAKDRYKNVHKAFALNKKYRDSIKGKNIVLIDDVYTTGATVKECAAALLAGGAGRVDILTLARVSRPGS